jgi:hypothetical protein
MVLHANESLILLFGYTMYNVQYIYILRVILRYSFTNLDEPNLPPPHTHTHTRTHPRTNTRAHSLCLSLIHSFTHTVIVLHTHSHSLTVTLTLTLLNSTLFSWRTSLVFLEDQSAMSWSVNSRQTEYNTAQHSTAQQTSKGAVICVLFWSKPVYQMYTFVSLISLSLMLIYWNNLKNFFCCKSFCICRTSKSEIFL